MHRIRRTGVPIGGLKWSGSLPWVLVYGCGWRVCERALHRWLSNTCHSLWRSSRSKEDQEGQGTCPGAHSETLCLCGRVWLWRHESQLSERARKTGWWLRLLQNTDGPSNSCSAQNDWERGWVYRDSKMKYSCEEDVEAMACALAAGLDPLPTLPCYPSEFSCCWFFVTRCRGPLVC